MPNTTRVPRSAPQGLYSQQRGLAISVYLPLTKAQQHLPQVLALPTPSTGDCVVEQALEDVLVPAALLKSSPGRVALQTRESWHGVPSNSRERLDARSADVGEPDGVLKVANVHNCAVQRQPLALVNSNGKGKSQWKLGSAVFAVILEPRGRLKTKADHVSAFDKRWPRVLCWIELDQHSS